MYYFWKFLLYFSEFCMIYTIGINLFYNFQMFISVLDLSSYKKKMKSSDYERYTESKNMVPISVLVPAYNEEMTIVDNIKSLLALNYFEYEIVIVNDGSQDATMARIIDEFGLVQVKQPYKKSLETQEILGIYRNPQYEKLVLVDKLNGGKADALNAGINVSAYPFFASIDADSVLDQDALVKLAMMFVERPDTVALGGIVRIANGSKLHNGELVEMKLPKSKVAGLQIVEYLRAFLTGRTSLSKLDSILIISGAFGAFNKQAVIDCGGYKLKSIGEDMDIIMRLHKFMKDRKQPYQIKFLADAVCWTQAPESLKDLRVQRRRWQIGLFDNLLSYKHMMLNPKYGKIGLITLPYYWIFELIGPVIEFLGYIFIPLAYLFGLLEFSSFLMFFMIAFLLGTTLSLGSILLEQFSFRRYLRFSDLMKLVGYAFIENLGFRQLTILYRVEGIIRFRKTRHAWGQIKRQEFASGKNNAAG
ncbi:glycosyltransferase family 2 protein [Paenibacillus sp. F411]|uniref:glycosyltransferase family 2 protein n=2 Tax=unclassified Paenibacillus TaxID=185978 RepID=UPI001AAFD617|nr:glycosyltransferase [Paenibacillus sp. F411]MBO2944592.1 glycosyltransferase family 2 protein [Paenibacillus sp. F411]